MRQNDKAWMVEYLSLHTAVTHCDLTAWNADGKDKNTFFDTLLYKIHSCTVINSLCISVMFIFLVFVTKTHYIVYTG